MSFSKKNQAKVVANSDIGSPETKLLEASESPKNLGSKQKPKDQIASPIMDESPKNLMNQNSSPIMDESPKKKVSEKQPKYNSSPKTDDYEQNFNGENVFKSFRQILKKNCHFSI